MADVRRVYEDERVVVEIVPDIGSYSNNAYLVSPAGGGAVTIIDAPEGSEAVVEALAGRTVERIVVTHSHRDHWLGFDVLRAHTDAPVYAGADETDLGASRDIRPLAHDAVLSVGDVSMQAIHTPGHTPGSTCLYIASADADRAGVLFTGDTLFPGGPGRTRDHASLERIIGSITSRLYVLPPATLVLPGHGASTTIGASLEEYRGFASRPHADDLTGDVLWAES